MQPRINVSAAICCNQVKVFDNLFIAQGEHKAPIILRGISAPGAQAVVVIHSAVEHHSQLAPVSAKSP